jgi:hypothetical protein
MREWPYPLLNLSGLKFVRFQEDLRVVEGLEKAPVPIGAAEFQ